MMQSLLSGMLSLSICLSVSVSVWSLHSTACMSDLMLLILSKLIHVSYFIYFGKSLNKALRTQGRIGGGGGGGGGGGAKPPSKLMRCVTYILTKILASEVPL